MALTPSGTISLGDINTALSRSATAPISMNDSQVRFLASQDSGVVTMDSMRNRYNNNGTATINFNNGPNFVYLYTNPITGGFFDGNSMFLSTYQYALVENSRTEATSYGSAPGTGLVPSPIPTMRLKVGSRAAIIMPTTGTSVGSNLWVAAAQLAIGSEQIGQTLNWQWSSI